MAQQVSEEASPTLAAQHGGAARSLESMFETLRTETDLKLESVHRIA